MKGVRMDGRAVQVRYVYGALSAPPNKNIEKSCIWKF